MNELIAQIRVASQAGLHYLALFGTLALPDICAGLSSADGKTSGPKYKDWIRTNVPDYADAAELLYGLRCSLLHQGRSLPHGGHYPIGFTFPPNPQIHWITTRSHDGTDSVLWLSVPAVIDELTTAVEAWLAQYGNTNTVQRNLEKFARYRPNGISPHIVGGPVIV